MKLNLLGIGAALALLLAAMSVTGGEQTELQKKADDVRATAAEMNFTKIPWVTDPAEGFRIAKNENRPVFLYLQAGDPLEDC